MHYLPLWQFEQFYHAYRAADGVLDFLTYSTVGCEAFDEAALHRHAAITAVRALTEAANLHSDRCLREGLTSRTAPKWQLDSEQVTGKRVLWKDFVGESEKEQQFLGLYPHLFLNPPYGLKISMTEATALLDRSLSVLNPKNAVAPVIYSWTTDWATYFDSGNEWWGAGLWTVSIEEGAAIAVIGASATD